jgi:hypothetical protein
VGKAGKMKAKVGAAMLMLLTAGLPLAVHGRDNERIGDRSRGIESVEMQRIAPAQQAAPGADPRQLRRDPREDTRAARLSPEERRQLRRDINDAGRELYRRQRQHHQD